MLTICCLDDKKRKRKHIIGPSASDVLIEIQCVPITVAIAGFLKYTSDCVSPELRNVF